jgi:hypothetical protein
VVVVVVFAFCLHDERLVISAALWRCAPTTLWLRIGERTFGCSAAAVS